MIQSRLEARARGFLQSGSLEDQRLKREEASVQLRKQKRFEHVAKRRAKLEARAEEEDGEMDEMVEDWEDYVEGLEEVLLQAEPSLRNSSLPANERLNLLLSLFTSASDSLLLPTATALKRLLGGSQSPPLAQVCRTDVIAKLVSLLDGEDKEVMYEVLWCITNLSYGPDDINCKIAAEGALPRLYRLVQHPEVKISDSAIWALSNMSTTESIRKDIIDNKVVEMCLDLFYSEAQQRKHDYANMLHLISNLTINCDFPPNSPFFTQVLTFVPWAFAQERESIISCACWICCYVADSVISERLEVIVNLGLLPKLMELMLVPSVSIVVPAVRAVGNIAGGSDSQTQALLDLDLLSNLHALLSHSERQIRKDAMWCLSNITAGTEEQTRSAIEHPVMTVALEKMNDVDLEMRREATWTVVNAIGILQFAEIQRLKFTKVVDPLCSSLDYNDAVLLKIALEGLMDLLTKEKAAGEAEVLGRFELLGGATALNSLMTHPNIHIWKLVSEILRSFFDSEEVPRSSLETPAPVPFYEFS